MKDDIQVTWRSKSKNETQSLEGDAVVVLVLKDGNIKAGGLATTSELLPLLIKHVDVNAIIAKAFGSKSGGS